MSKPLIETILACVMVFISLTASIVFLMNYKGIDRNSQIVLVKTECDHITSIGFNPTPINQDSCVLTSAAVLDVDHFNHVVNIKVLNEQGQTMILTVAPNSILTRSETYWNGLL